MMGLIGRVWTRGMPVELTGTNSPKAYTFLSMFVCLRPLYGFEITTLVGFVVATPPALCGVVIVGLRWL